MKTAVLINSLARGGAERQALHAVTHLNRLGCDATLVAYDEADEEYPLPADVARRFVRIARGGSRLALLHRMKTFFRREGFDLVHAFKGAENFYGVLGGRWARCPLLIGGYRVEYRESGILGRGFRTLDRLIEGWIVNAEVIGRTMSAATGIAADRFHVVPNGVDVEAVQSRLSADEARARLGLAPGTAVVTMVARLRPQKNHALLLEAARLLNDRRPVTFLLIGDGPLQASLAQRIEALQLVDNVKMLGDRSDVGDLLAATDVALLTSHFEGLSNVILESMAAGVPQVLTDFDGVGAALTHEREGLIVPRDDAGRIVAAIEQLLDHPAQGREMGAAGRARVAEHFSMEAMARRLLEVYEDLQAQRRARRG